MIGFLQTDQIDDETQADVFYAKLDENGEEGIPHEELYMEDGKPDVYRKFIIRKYPLEWAPKYRFSAEIYLD